MTQQQKEQISKLRANGASFGKIASALGISINTIKSYNEILKLPEGIHIVTVNTERCMVVRLQEDAFWDMDINCSATIPEVDAHRKMHKVS